MDFAPINPVISVANTTLCPEIWPISAGKWSFWRKIICSTDSNAPNVGLDRTYAFMQFVEGQVLWGQPREPRRLTRRQRCRRTSKHSRLSGLPPFWPHVARGSLNRLRNPNQWSWTNRPWTRCKTLTGCAASAGPTQLPRTSRLDQTRRQTCPQQSKHSWFWEPHSSWQLAVSRKSQWLIQSRWSWKSLPWTRCNVLIGSALRAGPSPRRRGYLVATSRQFETAFRGAPC